VVVKGRDWLVLRVGEASGEGEIVKSRREWFGLGCGGGSVVTDRDGCDV
jgi:hypothetical protein